MYLSGLTSFASLHVQALSFSSQQLGCLFLSVQNILNIQPRLLNYSAMDSEVQPLQGVARQVSLVWPDPAMGSHIKPIQAMANCGQAAMAILATSLYNV